MEGLKVPLRMEEAQSCTCASGIFEASCMAGVTMFIDSRELPNERKMCPSSTKEQEVRRFKSSALAIFRVSRRNRLEQNEVRRN